MPTWHFTVYLGDIWKVPGLSFEQQRDGVVERLRASGWIAQKGSDGGPLDRLVDELADAQDTAEFDDVWAEIYDYADVDRCWIDLLSTGP